MAKLMRSLPVAKKIQVTNLQRAEDMILFGKKDVEEVIVRKWILHTFEKWSNLGINYEKRQLIFIGDTNMSKMIIERILGCSRGTFPIKYLGYYYKPGLDS